jgi:hypothetical protein
MERCRTTPEVYGFEVVLKTGDYSRLAGIAENQIQQETQEALTRQHDKGLKVFSSQKCGEMS